MSRLSKMLFYNGYELWPLLICEEKRKKKYDTISDDTIEKHFRKPISSSVFIDATGIDIKSDINRNNDTWLNLKELRIAPPFKNTWFDLGEMTLVYDCEETIHKTALLIEMCPCDVVKQRRKVYFHLFCDAANKVVGPIYTVRLLIDNSGSIKSYSYGVPLMRTQIFNRDVQEGRVRVGGQLAKQLISRVISVMHFLDCKNTTIYPDLVTEKIQKQAKYRLGRRIKSYTMNVIKPGITYESVDAFGDKRKLPYHTRRGHTKTYGEDNPLFGKLVGSWYWFPRVLGNKKYGEIRKDYKFTSKEPVLV